MPNPIADFTQQLLSYGQQIHAIEAAADDDPADARLTIYAAASALLAQTPAAAAKAAPYLERARRTASEPDDRALLEAIEAWARGDLPAAIRLHGDRLRRRPDDLAAARICQLHQLDIGDAAGLLATVRLTLAADPANPYLLGQLAFALEQVGDVDGAEAAAHRALELAAGDDPWTHHAVAHALHARGDARAGIAWIERHAPLWDRSNAFMRAHAWWHAALSLIDLDDGVAALGVYDREIATGCPHCAQSLAMAVSLLTRLELRGIDVARRWDAIADRLADHADDRVNGFLDLHYLLGLARVGHPAAAALARALAATPAGEGARGLVAWVAGRYAEAAAALAAAAAALARLGGSHEERDLYALIELDAAGRAGQMAQARRLLQQRTARHGGAGWERRMLAELRAAA